jgi:hypothetical protein
MAKCTKGHISIAHTNEGHQGLRLEVRKLGYTFCFEGCWCEKCCFEASCNDDGKCKQHYNRKDH